MTSDLSYLRAKLDAASARILDLSRERDELQARVDADHAALTAGAKALDEARDRLAKMGSIAHGLWVQRNFGGWHPIVQDLGERLRNLEERDEGKTHEARAPRSADAERLTKERDEARAEVARLREPVADVEKEVDRVLRFTKDWGGNRDIPGVIVGVGRDGVDEFSCEVTSDRFYSADYRGEAARVVEESRQRIRDLVARASGARTVADIQQDRALFREHERLRLECIGALTNVGEFLPVDSDPTAAGIVASRIKSLGAYRDGACAALDHANKINAEALRCVDEQRTRADAAEAQVAALRAAHVEAKPRIESTDALRFLVVDDIGLVHAACADERDAKSVARTNDKWRVVDAQKGGAA